MTTYSYPLQFLDPDCYGVVSGAAQTTAPLTVGSDFQNGDVRLILVVGYSTTITFTTFTGWSKLFDTTVSGAWRIGLFRRLLTPTAVDGVLGFSSTGDYYVCICITARNADPNQAISLTQTSTVNGALSSTAPSVSTPNTGAVLNFFHAAGAATAFSLPSGMTELVPNTVVDSELSYLSAISVAGGGSSGTHTSTISGAPTGNLAGSVFVSAIPDVNASISTATSETDTATAATASLLNSVSFQIKTALPEVDIANQMATPLTGYRISPPLALPQSPITNSVIHWEEVTLAPGSSVLVESSIDNGLTWQRCTSDEPIPRLLYGYNVATTLLTRVTLNRLSMTDQTPTAQNLEVRVATDASQNELVSLGVFYITSTEVTMSGGSGTGSSGSGGGGSGVTGSGGGSTGGALSIQISGVDQSRQVSRNTWQDVYYIPANTNYAVAIQEIVDNRLPGLQYNFQSTPFVTPKIVLGTQLGNDPWQDAQDLATAIGFELFFDAAGICTLREVPDPATTQSVWTFTDGANPTIAQLDRTLTDQTTYNYVICYGESVDNTEPVQAVAFDDDPNSPTYYLGPYGIVSTTFQSAMITTTAQAQAAANALLLAVKGASENVALTVVPNPALEPGDVVTVEVSDAKITGTFLVNDIQTPLSAGEGQTLTVYRQTS